MLTNGARAIDAMKGKDGRFHNRSGRAVTVSMYESQVANVEGVAFLMKSRR